jgi:hypothetical protein
VIASESNPFVPTYNTLYDNTNLIDRRVRGLFIKSKDALSILFYEMTSKITYLATLDYSTSRMIFIKILPNMPTDFQTIAIFATDVLFFTASKGT